MILSFSCSAPLHLLWDDNESSFNESEITVQLKIRETSVTPACSDFQALENVRTFN